jgi:hypothetical protein
MMFDEAFDVEADYGEFDEFDVESFDEFDVESDWSERAKPRPGQPPRRLKTPPRGNAAVKPPRSGFATKAELDATAKKLDARIAVNSGAVKALDARTRASEASTAKMGDALRKEIALRKKETGELKRGLDESRQLAMIVPILTAGAAPDDKFAKILPIMLYSGALGGSGGGLGGSTADGNNSMMMMAMAMTLID